MYYEIFQKLCESKGVKPGTVSRATGISTATFTSWKQGKYTPKTEKLQKIADYFAVPVEYLTSGGAVTYYTNPETAAMAQKYFDDPNYKILFDAAEGSSPENIRLAAEMLKRMKATNPDG